MPHRLCMRHLVYMRTQVRAGVADGDIDVTSTAAGKVWKNISGLIKGWSRPTCSGRQRSEQPHQQRNAPVPRLAMARDRQASIQAARAKDQLRERGPTRLSRLLRRLQVRAFSRGRRSRWGDDVAIGDRSSGRCSNTRAWEPVSRRSRARLFPQERIHAGRHRITRRLGSTSQRLQLFVPPDS
jgi:hypothetical protein